MTMWSDAPAMQTVRRRAGRSRNSCGLSTMRANVAFTSLPRVPLGAGRLASGSSITKAS